MKKIFLFCFSMLSALLIWLGRYRFGKASSEHGEGSPVLSFRRDQADH